MHLTLTEVVLCGVGKDNLPDGNPEAVMIGSPLDGTKNPAPSLGSQFSDITGIVTYQ